MRYNVGNFGGNEMRVSIKGFGIKHTYRSMIFWGMILSYTIVFLLPNIFAIFTYEKYSSTLEEKVVNSLDNNLGQAQNIIDSQFKSLDEISITINRNKRLYSILTAQDLNRFSSYDLYEGVVELSSYKVMNNFVENILFYKPKDDFIISSAISTDFNTYFNNILAYENIKLVDLKKLIVNEKYINILPAQSIREQNTKSDKITYIQNLAYNGVNSLDVRFIATINNDSFVEILKKVLGDYNGSIYILNKDNQIITSLVKSDSGVNKDILTDFLKSNKKYITTTINNENMLITSVKSDRMQWDYIAVIPTNQVFDELNKIRNVCLLISLILFLGCTFLIIYFANRNYKPVRNVVKMLNPEKAEDYTNEWEVIKKEVNSTLKGKKTLEDYISLQMPVIRSNYVMLLMKGSSKNNESSNPRLKHLDIKIEKGPFAVMIISVDGYKENTGVDRSIDGEDMLLYKSAVRNVVEELCMSNGKGYTTEPGEDEVGVLISFNSLEKEKNIDEMNRIAKKILDTFDQYFNLTLTVGIGNMYNDLPEIKNSYNEARVALEYKIIKGNNTIIKYEDIKVVPGLVNYYSVVNEKAILDCLKRGDIDGISAILKDIMKNLRENLPPLDTARCIYFEILNTALKAFDLVGIENYDSLSINTRFQALFHSDTIDQLYNETLQFYTDICSYINGRKESKNFKLANDIQEYINSNYSDCNFSLIMLADYFKLSTSYLSRFYKDQFGYTISEYIQKKRVEAAKELLRSTGKNIVDIAEELGFGNVHSFINTFKKHEGITPGEFRSKIS